MSPHTKTVCWHSNRRHDHVPKSTIALAIIVGITSGALAATKKQHSPNTAWDVTTTAVFTSARTRIRSFA